MPSSTTRPGRPSNVHQGSKRTMSDPETAPQHTKKARRDPPAEPSAGRDVGSDAKRKKRKKRKKTPVVSVGDAKARTEEPPRVPLSARNDIIRFTSVPPAADQPANALHDTQDRALSSRQLSKSPENSVPTEDVSERRCTSTLKCRPSNSEPVPGPSSGKLEDKVAQLEAELKSKNSLIASHHALLNQVHQAVACQVCLDLMYKPYALAPCGHLACHSCLVSWFTAPPPDNRPAPPAIMRRKTCPHCRAVVRERPVGVWGVKNIALAVGNSGLLPNQLPVPVEAPENLNANIDPWKDIFPKLGTPARRGLPWFFPGADIDDDDVDIADSAPRSEAVGMLDMEDGGIYRCFDCMHEIWDGVCSSCGRVYPGHGGDDEEFEENAMGWLEDQMGAEEVDVADDPGWMGLEDGEADDDGGDMGDWRPIDPWRRRFHMFRGPWGLFGTIHVDEEDEEEQDDVHARVHNLRVLEDESADEGYESSFIDDGDGGGGIANYFDRPRFYEVDDDDEYEDRGRSRDPVPDDHEAEEEAFDTHERGWTERRHGGIVISSDAEADDLEDSPRRPVRRYSRGEHQRRGHGIVESDGSDSC